MPDGVPTLRSSDVRSLRLDLHGVKRVAPVIAGQFKRTFLRGNEILVTVRGTLGGVVVAPHQCSGFNISREVAMLALVDEEIAKTMAIFIASGPIQRWLMQRTKGIAYTGINIETLKELPLPVPSIAEQQQIVAEVERRLSVIEELEPLLKATSPAPTACGSLSSRVLFGQFGHFGRCCMSSLEDIFSSWAQGPGKTEAEKCENAESAVRRAIATDSVLSRLDVTAFAQGSYRGRTNVKQDSDVDICVRLNEVFFADYPDGKAHGDFGNIDGRLQFPDFKNMVEKALRSHFGSSSVTRGNKAFDVHANTYRVDADVVPTFEHRRYTGGRIMPTGVITTFRE